MVVCGIGTWMETSRLLHGTRRAAASGLGALLAGLLVCSLAPAVEAGELYRWKDSSGRLHFSDRLPGAQDGAADLKVYSYEQPEVVAPPPASARPGPSPAAAAGTGPPRVVLYTTQWCGYCRRAREYLRTRGIPFEEHDVEQSAQGQREFRALGGGGVPLILVGQRRMNGFTPAAFERLWEAAAAEKRP
jgi:glutaredoxin